MREIKKLGFGLMRLPQRNYYNWEEPFIQSKKCYMD